MKNSYTPQERRVLRRFVERLRTLRQARGLTQENLAEASEMNRNYLSDVERGTRNISILNLHLLARAFGMPMRELFPEDL